MDKRDTYILGGWILEEWRQEKSRQLQEEFVKRFKSEAREVAEKHGADSDYFKIWKESAERYYNWKLDESEENLNESF